VTPTLGYLLALLVIVFVIDFTLRALPFKILEPLRDSRFVSDMAVWMPPGIMLTLVRSPLTHNAHTAGDHWWVALAATGAAYAFLSPALGWVGTAVAGSATSAGALFANLQATAAQGAGRLRPLEPDSYRRRPWVLQGSGGAVHVLTPPTSDRGRTSQPRTAFSHRRLRPGTRILEAYAVLAAKVRPRSTSAFSTASATLLPRPVRSPSQIRAVMHNAIRF